MSELKQKGVVKDTDEYKLIQCKVNPTSYKQLHRICLKLGISLYVMLQNMAETLVRFCDDRHQLSEEMNQAVMLFSRVKDWKRQVRLVDVHAEPEVKRAIYFVCDKKNKKGEKVLMVDEQLCGVQECTENVQLITEAFMEQVLPNQYKWLRQVGVELECNSTMETLMAIVNMYRDSDDVKELRKMFADSRRMDNGKESELRKYRKTLSAESIDRRIMKQRKLFE